MRSRWMWRRMETSAGSSWSSRFREAMARATANVNGAPVSRMNTAGFVRSRLCAASLADLLISSRSSCEPGEAPARFREVDAERGPGEETEAPGRDDRLPVPGDAWRDAPVAHRRDHR